MAVDYSALGEKIRGYRVKRGFTQEKLAEEANRSSTYISHIERGVKSMSLDTLVEVANALNITADSLLVDELDNTIVITNHEFASLIADCSEYERRVLLEVVKSTKTAMRSFSYCQRPKY